MNGFATIAQEIVEADKRNVIDYVLLPATNGGFVSAIASALKQISPITKIIAVELDSCKHISTSILEGKPMELDNTSKFFYGLSNYFISS